VFNLRSDPFEKGDRVSMDYAHWLVDRSFLLVPAQGYVGEFLTSFKEFPPSQKVGSFSIDKVMESLQSAQAGN
jgi:arylsulfatase